MNQTTKQFVAPAADQSPDELSAAYQAPSNIALVKYWGKHGMQLPANPSLSFTLKKCRTESRLTAQRHDENVPAISIKYDGVEKPEFHPKVMQFLERIQPYCPWIKHYRFTLDTVNTFPHSSGIASSASSMAAMASCIMDMETQLIGERMEHKASFLARLGSGSACRSLQGKAVVWGKHEQIENSSDLYGVNVESILHQNFRNYQDTILLVDEGKKSVSSTAGHDLMNDHPYAPTRFQSAHKNLNLLNQVLGNGDLDEFVKLVESEALTLHAMMMSSQPYYLLMKPGTLAIIEAVFRFRESEKIPLCFTLDAGANVHLLYPEKHKTAVKSFINSELIQYCQAGKYICDLMGSGATPL